MNDKRLRIYINDHLALMLGEAELAHRSGSSNRETSLGRFLLRLESEIRIQKSIGEDVVRCTGGRENPIKQGAAWVAERLGRFKLNSSLLSYSALSRLIELEALTAAAFERIAFWETMHVVLQSDPRVSELDFAALQEESQRSLDELQDHRRTAATWAFIEH